MEFEDIQVSGCDDDKPTNQFIKGRIHKKKKKKWRTSFSSTGLQAATNTESSHNTYGLHFQFAVHNKHHCCLINTHYKFLNITADLLECAVNHSNEAWSHVINQARSLIQDWEILGWARKRSNKPKDFIWVRLKMRKHLQVDNPAAANEVWVSGEKESARSRGQLTTRLCNKAGAPLVVLVNINDMYWRQCAAAILPQEGRRSLLFHNVASWPMSLFIWRVEKDSKLGDWFLNRWRKAGWKI